MVYKCFVKNRIEDAKKSLMHDPAPDTRLVYTAPLGVRNKKRHIRRGQYIFLFSALCISKRFSSSAASNSCTSGLRVFPRLNSFHAASRFSSDIIRSYELSSEIL